ncbi:gcn5-related n-acetyltransferase [Leptolyngbya sp. Heron Island J]|uniref:GNAT family N-acetyltransferase n=1 Tax=Leptolyngbya sp. Heron Island J TaxID=1385935 RepID=UPI0003B9F614|nr:N-acetyltransferase [Leptolyngbya sp. Heron Island J]ESA38974.1 gcn5-related n-acetyltransferase [Leptolyngbya sp. Heron Island J]
MKCIIRPLTLEDEPFLWEMLYQALYVPAGHPAWPREIVQIPEIAHYVNGWGDQGDCGFLASNPVTGESIGAVWLRLLISNNKGYGHIDDNTPELSIAVLPEYRGQGIGTQLLTHLFAASEQSSISLSVSANNPAVRLYRRFGFEVVKSNQESLTMRRC